MSGVSGFTAREQAHERRGGGRLAVLAETAYPLNVASARVRVANFVPFLRQHGVELGYHPNMTDHDYAAIASAGGAAAKALVLGRAAAGAVIRRRAAHDLLMVHRLRLLHPLPRFDPPRRLDVYDIDDPLFLRFSGGVNSRFRWTKQESRRCIACLRASRLTIVGNSFLADRARQFASRVEIVPSCIDPSSQPLRAHRQQTPVTVGWIGSPTTSPYLLDVFPVFERLNADRPRAKLVLVGADSRIDAPWIEHRPWSLATERDDLASFDVGIMPQPDDEWARGKCGFKVLQYFAAGVPAIGSPVGVTRELIGTERGLIADGHDAWYRALTAMIEDPQMRAEQGAAARVFVERDYSYQAWAPELAGLLRTVAR
jgi:glycosyltransferase involved in cell wall biosynthesis